MPPANLLSDIMGRSPLEPMQKHMAVVHQCACELTPFFQAAYSRDWDMAAKARSHITELEHQADDIQKSIRLHLPRSLFLPVARADLITLLATQDKIANRAKDISGRMLGRKMHIPSEIQQPVFDYLQRSIAASEQALKAINELDELIATGFGGREIRLVEDMVEELDSLENQTDQLEVDIRAKLFAIEDRLNPVDVIFLYQIIGQIGDIADQAQRVGGRLLILLAR